MAGAADRSAMLAALRRLGGFDINGDPPTGQSGFGAPTRRGISRQTARCRHVARRAVSRSG
jgi:hypothetical protein